MEGIWVLVFIGYIVFKVLGGGRKLKEVTERVPRDWEKRLGPGFPLNWDDEEEEDNHFPARVDDSRLKTLKKPAEATSGEKLPAVPVNVSRTVASGTTVKSGDDGAGSFAWPRWEADNVVSGIIFSEILGPPRSRRKRIPGSQRY